MISWNPFFTFIDTGLCLKKPTVLHTHVIKFNSNMECKRWDDKLPSMEQTSVIHSSHFRATRLLEVQTQM